MTTSKSLIPVERIEKSILLIRGHKVMLDSDLAELYGVTTAALNQAVKRNIGRFPEDFAFQLTEDEFASLISQIVTSKTGRGGRRKLPWAFTEHGILMLSSVLRSERAVQANIQIMRAFIRMRQLLASNKGLMEKILSMEKKYNEQFQKSLSGHLPAHDRRRKKTQTSNRVQNKRRQIIYCTLCLKCALFPCVL